MVCFRKRLLCCAAAAVVVALAGCGKSNIVKVNGVLTYNGTAVTNAYLYFEREDGQGRQSWAQTDDKGRFKINYDAHQDGVVVGKHKVWLEPRPVTVAEKEAAQIGGIQPPRSKDQADLNAFFKKYNADNSTLTIEITHDTTELQLDLK